MPFVPSSASMTSGTASQSASQFFASSERSASMRFNTPSSRARSAALSCVRAPATARIRVADAVVVFFVLLVAIARACRAPTRRIKNPTVTRTGAPQADRGRRTIAP